MTNKILILVFVMFGCLIGFAAPVPAPPPAAPGPPEPPAPIDGTGLLMLIFAAILLGIYVIYKNKLKTKASV